MISPLPYKMWFCIWCSLQQSSVTAEFSGPRNLGVDGVYDQ